jgi:hypothetical protein
MTREATWGTAYFVSRKAAERYYSDYEGDADDTRRAVDRKLAEGIIHIGKPNLELGQTLTVGDNGTRYFITQRHLSERKETKMNTDQPRYDVFLRNWWKLNPAWPGGREPGMGRKRYIARKLSYAEAVALCKEYNATHKPGKLSRKAEFEQR